MSAILDNQHLQIIAGDDYLAADGRALSFSGYGVTWPSVAPASVKLSFFNPLGSCENDPAIDIDGVLDWVSTPKTVAFDMTRAQSVTLSIGVRVYGFEVRALTASGSVITLVRGLASVANSRG